MSPLDTLGHLEAENARLERDNAQLIHDKHRAIAERDRARDLAVELEQENAALIGTLELLLMLTLMPTEQEAADAPAAD